MKNGEVCMFRMTIKDDMYCVRCECYESLYDGKLAYGNTYFKNGEEVMHAGQGEMIDTMDKARKQIDSLDEFLERLPKIAEAIEDE